MNNKIKPESPHDNLRDLIGQAISDEIGAGAEQPDWCDSREIDRLADAVLAVLPKRRTTLSPELRAALKQAAQTGATVAEVSGGGPVFINRGEQPEDDLDLHCPACGGSGHADDARGAAPAPAGADDAFAAFCDREGYPSDGESDVMLRAAFDEGLRFAASQTSADAAPVDAKPLTTVIASMCKAINSTLIAGGDYGDELSDHSLRAELKAAEREGFKALIANGIYRISYCINPLSAMIAATAAQPSIAQGDVLAKCEARMLRMATCAGEFAREACNIQHSDSKGGERDAALLEKAAQACDQQADGTNGPYRSACLQCANAVRALRDASIVGQPGSSHPARPAPKETPP